MHTKYEQTLNPKRYKLSPEALKKLKWIYELEQKHNGNITACSRNLHITREWLTKIYGKFKSNDRDPRWLENKSRAPHNTSDRKRTSRDTVDKIIQLRLDKKYSTWGKEKLARLMWTQHQIKISPSTVNRYMAKAKLLNVRISHKNKLAFKNKILTQKIKQRPPKAIKDYKPGALVEKDMKFIVKQGKFINTEKFKASENFFFQHTMIDDFTRLRVLDAVPASDSLTAKKSFLKSKSRFPFSIVCLNTDSGGENGKDFADYLTKQNIIHFFSRTGTPTDNPRVERSHLTDEVEFYGQGNRQHKDLKSLKQALNTHEHTYNFIRPHQALGYLTPMEFYELWKADPQAAYNIKDKWQKYLAKQSKRLHIARRMKKKEKIEALMQHIDSVLNRQNQPLKV
jgi:transposase InsO family protein